MAFNIDPHLEDKSLLVFEFKLSKPTAVAKTFRRLLNFIENITVKESVETNYSEYTPIGSNGSVFAYLGAKSRKLDLDFNLTLPNIQEHTLIKPTAKNPSTTAAVATESYFNTENLGHRDDAISYAKLLETFSMAFHQDMSDTEKKFFKKTHDSLATEIFPIDTSQPPAALKKQEEEKNDSQQDSPRMRSIYQVMYWVNLIRSSVLTHSKKPYLGPPIITLTHGIMFMSVPCICTSYSIDNDEAAGYDPITLLPRRLKITMSLREVRLRGGDFAPSEGNSRNMPGWNSLYDEDKEFQQGHLTMDPFDQVENTIIL
jgi:hypothetical protein